MEFTEERKKAFDFCADAIKQLITLATGIIVVTITFAKDFVIEVNESSKCYAYIAWALYLVSVVCGMLGLLALTAELEPRKTKISPVPKSPPESPPESPPDGENKQPSIRGAAATWSFFQIVAFAFALVFTVTFAVKAVSNSNKNLPNKATEVKLDTVRVKLYQK